MTLDYCSERWGEGFRKAKRIARYLLDHYVAWGNSGAPMQCWKDFGARDAYYELVKVWGLRREA